MKKLAVGLLAHVDAGKTTLSEALLYTAGAIRRLGRVDHRDAFLDTDPQERRRGITIFSKQAVFSFEGAEFTLLDTPGHEDFAAEMERTLQILDCAVLVVSASDGVQAHTGTLWRLLARLNVPTAIFVNKMDLPGTDRGALLASLREGLDVNCVDFSAGDGEIREECAASDESALGEYLASGTLTDDTLRRLIGERAVFPCWFGSALKLEGVESFLRGLARFAPAPAYGPDFGARVFKIGRDGQGARLTWLKVTGGTLRVKDLLAGTDGAERWSEKAEQIRLYSGERFRPLEAAEAGTVCAVLGLSHTRAGDGLGFEERALPPVLEAVLDYRLLLPEGTDPHAALETLRPLAEEDPSLHLCWDSRSREIRFRPMGQVQLEVLRQVLLDRFGLAADFAPGSIVYKETIAAPAEGVGHYEPLRHYAEVRLLLEPGEPGSGLRFASACPEDELDRSWQRLILTHLAEKRHLGVLTGSPVTDMRITLLTGRAHLKHTEGGDFRQATYRAVRQGLMEAQSVLLEPWYDFVLELPAGCVGRAMADVQAMGGRCGPPETAGESARLAGSAPCSELGGYGRELAAYTRGRGRLSLVLRGYEPCHNASEVIAAAGYDPEADPDNSPDSVFCSHGAGYVVKWDRVPAMAHTAGETRPPAAGAAREDDGPPAEKRRPQPPPARSRESDEALRAIFERTYGEVKPRAMQPPPRTPPVLAARTVPPRNEGPEYLLVDGYNIIFAWDELKELGRKDLEGARYALMDLLCNYQGFRKNVVILVFDAYRVRGNPGSAERYHNIYVVYTKEAETADAYIERATYALAPTRRVRVATSDALEQLIILGHGAVRVSAREFHEELEAAEGRISELIERGNRGGREFRRMKYHLKETKE